MIQVDAVYQGGVFRPLGKVSVAEHERVRLHVESLNGGNARAWLEQVKSLQQQFTERHGHLPDSTPDIAADRLR